MNIDYNKPSMLWFRDFQQENPSLLLSNHANAIEFDVTLTEECVANLNSVDDVHALFGPEYVVTLALGMPGALLVVQTKIDTDNTLDKNKNVKHFAAEPPPIALELPEQPIQTLTNDPKWNEQWGLNSNNPWHINVESVWANASVGDRNVVCAVLDTGTRLTHEDIVDNLWTNPNPGRTSGGDPFTNDVHGIGVSATGAGPDDTYDEVPNQYGGQFCGSHADPLIRQAVLDHGSHCAGIIGGTGSNGRGVTGVCQQVSIMTCRGFRVFSGTYTSNGVTKCYCTGDPPPSDGTPCPRCMLIKHADQALMINYITAQKQAGVNVRAVNLSLGGQGLFYHNQNSNKRRAFAAGSAQGIVYVFSAGNDNVDIDNIPDYRYVDPSTGQVGYYPQSYWPAAFANENNFPDIVGIAVAAMTDEGKGASFSNYGQQSVQIAAPGHTIMSLGSTSNTNYRNMSGTSMAAPMVAGAVSLLAAAQPNASASDIRNAIIQSATQTDAFRHTLVPGAEEHRPVVSEGRLNVAGALARLTSSTPSPVTNSVVVSNVEFNLNVVNNHPFYGCGSNLSPTVTWNTTFGGSCNSSNTTFSLVMKDIDAGDSIHWNIININGNANSVSSGQISGGTIDSITWGAQQNGDGYAGPFPPFQSTHRYTIEITPSSVISGTTHTQGTKTRTNAVCSTTSPPPVSPPPVSPPPVSPPPVSPPPVSPPPVSPPPPIIGTNGTVQYLGTLDPHYLGKSGVKTFFSQSLGPTSPNRRIFLWGLVTYFPAGEVRTSATIDVNGTEYNCIRYGEQPLGAPLGTGFGNYWGRWEVYVSDEIPTGSVGDIKFSSASNGMRSTQFGTFSVLVGHGFNLIPSLNSSSTQNLVVTMPDKSFNLPIGRQENRITSGFTLNNVNDPSYSWIEARVGQGWFQNTTGGSLTKTFSSTATQIDANSQGYRAPILYGANFTVAVAPSVTPTPTPTPTPAGPPPPPPPPAIIYPNSADELYVGDSSGNVYVVDVKDKGKPSVIKGSDDNPVSIRGSAGLRKIAIHRQNNTDRYDQFYASDYNTGGFKTGTFHNTANDVTYLARTQNDFTLSYLKIVWNQKIINFEHYFRENSNIKLSFDTTADLGRRGGSGQLRNFVQLNNVAVCPLKTNEDGFTKEFLLSTTTSIPDYFSPLGFNVRCPTDSTLNRVFSNRTDAISYQNILIANGCAATASSSADITSPVYSTLPTAYLASDRKDIFLEVQPRRSSSVPQIANAYRQVYKMSSPIIYTDSDRFEYTLLGAGYHSPRDITSISSGSAGGLGRPTDPTNAPCTQNRSIGLMNQSTSIAKKMVRSGTPPALTSTKYDSAIKVIAGKYQTITIDSDGDAYYTGNSNYGPFDAGSLVSLSATGGEITTSGQYTIHTFKQNGVFNINNAPANAEFDILIVGGGGGGGANRGGGGGGGGLIYETNQTMTGGTYNVTVGAGGSGAGTGPASNATQGGSSSIIGPSVSLTALGGGRGGSANGGHTRNGGSGGSGGGSAYNSRGNNPTAGAGTSGQGNSGGRTGNLNTNDPRNTGGGGGAGAAGTGGYSPNMNGSDDYGTDPNGGVGLQVDISGTNSYYAGGGGGSSGKGPEERQGYTTANRGLGGNGGGGDGGASNASPHLGTDGIANTGGGGGGSSAYTGASGGSGVVIIRYKTAATGGGSDELDHMRKIQAYTLSGSTYNPVNVSFVDAAIMTYNHQGANLADKATYTVFLLDDRGELYTFGFDSSASARHQYQCVKYEKELILEKSIAPNNTYPPTNINSISAGADHVIIVRHSKMYGMGSNARGQLGLPSSVPYVSSFRYINSNQNARIAQVACGPYHTMAMDTDGNIIVTGDNTDGQLGLGLNPNTNKNDHARYGFNVLNTSNLSAYPAKFIFASNCADHYVYQYPCTTNGRTRACQPGEDANKPPVRSKSNCGYVDVLNRVWVWGDRSYGQAGNLLSSTHNSTGTVGPYVADGRMMIAPVYVPYFYTGFRGSIVKNQSFIDNIPSSYSSKVKKGYFINFNFLYTTTAANSVYDSVNNRTTITLNSVEGVESGMWLQIGPTRAWGTGSQKGQVIAVNASAKTVTVIGNNTINNNYAVVFKAFKQHTRILSVEVNSDGTLKANVSTPSGYTKSYSGTEATSIAYTYYYLRSENVAAGKDGIGLIDTGGRFIHFGLDKGYRNSCAAVDKAMGIPWLAEGSANINDFVDISYGLDHLMLLRKEEPAQ